MNGEVRGSRAEARGGGEDGGETKGGGRGRGKRALIERQN